MTIEQLRELARAYRIAYRAFVEHHATRPEPFDYRNELHIRWEIQNKLFCSASVDAQTPYRKACDEFFASEEMEAAQ